MLVNKLTIVIAEPNCYHIAVCIMQAYKE